MEEPAKPHTTSDSLDLIKWTNCNTTCLSVLKENCVLSDEDEAELDSIQNKYEKSRKLYQLLLTKKGWYLHLIFALKEDCQTGALKLLEKLGGEEEVVKCFGASATVSAQKSAKPVRFDVIVPVSNFTGREPQLCDLHQKLQDNIDKRAVISQMASIVGLGGIGKTELARKYIQEYGEEFYDGNVIWISAQSEETLSDSFRRLASDHLNLRTTNVDKRNIDTATLVTKIYSYFNEQRVLFVFDNAESTDYLPKFMPLGLSPSISAPYILITSRDREWSFSAPVLELDEMTEEDAITFVKTSLEMENDDDNGEIMRLVNRLQRYPLALSQATSYIKHCRSLGNFSISEYLDKFEENSAKLLDSKKPPAEFNSYRETTLTTWRVTTQQISSDEENGRCAMEILNCISYFLPDKIPMRIFAKLSVRDEYQEALSLLVKYSMLNVQREEEMCSVHRLVQQVTRIQLKKTNQEEHALRTALQLVSSCTEDEFGDELFYHTIYHALSAYKFCCVLNPELSKKFKQLPSKIVGIFAWNMKQDESETVGQELEDLLSKIVLPEDSDLIRLKVKLLYTVRYRDVNFLESRLEELEKLHKIYVENKENSFTWNELVGVERLVVKYLKKLGRFHEALELSRNMFKRQKTLNGLNNSRTIITLVNLAQCLWDFKESGTSEDPTEEEWTELMSAVSVMKVVHQVNLELVGKDFYWTQAMVRLAYFLYDIFDTKCVISILKVVMKRITEGLDKRFLVTEICCMTLLGTIQTDKEECEKLLVYWQSLHSKLVTWRGKTDELTLNIQERMGAAFLKLGKLEEATQTYTDILKILEKKRKLPHPDRPLENYKQLVENLCEMGRSEVNLQRLGIMKTMIETEFGESHPLLSTVKCQIELLSRDNFEVFA